MLRALRRARLASLLALFIITGSVPMSTSGIVAPATQSHQCAAPVSSAASAAGAGQLSALAPPLAL